MENERFARLQKSTMRHLAMEAQETLRRVADFPDNPAAMAVFYQFFSEFFNGNYSPPEAKPIIGTMCTQVPAELIHAAGAVPLRLCSGAYAYDQVGAEFMPARSCPLVKATVGMLHVNRALWGDALKSVVIPTTCDQKKKSVEFLRDMGFAVYALEMPPAKESDVARFYWQESVKQFALDLGGMTGRKITVRSMREGIDKLQQASWLFRKLQELRRADPPVFLGKDAMLVTNAWFVMDHNSWCAAVTRLIEELEKRQSHFFPPGNRPVPRLLLTGSPPIFPNLKVPLLVEQAGAVIVTDEVCSSSRLLHDAVSYDEATLDEMVGAVADRSLKPCTCPCLSANPDRMRKIMELTNRFDVDGVLYHAFAGCLPYEMEQRQVGKALGATGIPMLSVETDYSPEDLGQLSTRIEAFIESIKARKKKR